MLMTSITLRRKPYKFICHCIQAWLGMGHINIEAVGLMGDNANSINTY